VNPINLFLAGLLVGFALEDVDRGNHKSAVVEFFIAGFNLIAGFI
jgi:hypothetical protein